MKYKDSYHHIWRIIGYRPSVRGSRIPVLWNDIMGEGLWDGGRDLKAVY